MISRRNIRIKVMQTLYTAAARNNEIEKKELLRMLDDHFAQTRSLLVYLIWMLTEVSRYAEKDARQRMSRFLPDESDRNVNTRLTENEIIVRILSDTALQNEFLRCKPQLVQQRPEEGGQDIIRTIYQKLTSTREYKDYIARKERDKTEERRILEFILNELILSNEDLLSHLEEHYSNWQDDAEMLLILLSSYLQKPAVYPFTHLISEEKKEFARSLLMTVSEKNEHLQSYIIPRLKNWDPDRIALLDMIIMKMGVAEFLYFETIPPKVTINEYIDLAKDYSTAQSGQFVNGILDNIHKELSQQGKLQKVDFRKT